MNKVKLPQVLAPLQARLQALESSTNGVAATAPIAGAGDGAGAGAGAGGVGGGDGAAAAATDATTQALLQRVADIEARVATHTAKQDGAATGAAIHMLVRRMDDTELHVTSMQGQLAQVESLEATTSAIVQSLTRQVEELTSRCSSPRAVMQPIPARRPATMAAPVASTMAVQASTAPATKVSHGSAGVSGTGAGDGGGGSSALGTAAGTLPPRPVLLRRRDTPAVAATTPSHVDGPDASAPASASASTHSALALLQGGGASTTARLANTSVDTDTRHAAVSLFQLAEQSRLNSGGGGGGGDVYTSVVSRGGTGLSSMSAGVSASQMLDALTDATVPSLAAIAANKELAHVRGSGHSSQRQPHYHQRDSTAAAGASAGVDPDTARALAAARSLNRTLDDMIESEERSARSGTSSPREPAARSRRHGVDAFGVTMGSQGGSRSLRRGAGVARLPQSPPRAPVVNHPVHGAGHVATVTAGRHSAWEKTLRR